MLAIQRSSKNPLITPMREHGWENVAAYNPSAVRTNGDTHIFYRAGAEPDKLRTPDRSFSTIGHALFANGGLTSERTRVIAPSESWDAYGCEDPRATFFEGKWYVFYTALGGYPFGPDNIKCAVAMGTTPDALTEKHLITPFNAKAMTLFPERVDGEVCLLLTAHTDFTPEHPRPTIGIARAKEVSDFFNPTYWEAWHQNLGEHALPDVRRADSEHMEVAATPIKTEHGWLLVYSHIQNYYDEHARIFGVEALILDASDPRKVLAKTAYPFMVPEEFYERYGLVANVVFPSGALLNGDRLEIYYGAADTSCATAALSFADLYDTMSETKRSMFLTRVQHNPILEPNPEHSWESKNVMNAAAIDLDGSIHLLYRAMGLENTSVLGYARLKDGLHIDEKLDAPVYLPREPFEQKLGDAHGNSGCEDPRLTRIGDTIYLCYTSYDGVHPPRGTISSISVDAFRAKKFTEWATPKLVTPEDVADKDLALFPELVNGKVMLLHRLDPTICADQFESTEFERVANRCIEVMGPRPGMWDGIKIGAAGPPIKVPEGWLFIYHGVGHDHAYRLGAALLGADGVSVLARSAVPILEPLLDWERIGEIPNVVFSCGSILREDTLFVYYGGGDSALAVATVSKSALMKKLLPNI
ncbi:MAG: glycosidase ph1107-related protein [Parcubacteria bacterium C7867-001]|nr:MAG: glycosidase ph1107-related protein [Parcubacteria bacterium C7867-001]